MNFKNSYEFFSFCSLLTSLCSLLLLTSCIDKTDVSYNLNSSVLTVEGQVSDTAPTVVNLTYSQTNGRSVYTETIKNAKVEILVGDGSKISLIETNPGTYETNSDFRGKINQTYQLVFKLMNGTTYQSTVEKLIGVPEIKKIYHSFNPNGILDGTGKRVLGATFDVYVDFEDPADQKNFYLWKWQLFEKQGICLTCEQGYLNSFTQKCVTTMNRSPTYDYECNGNCWEILYSQDINILSDVFTNGKNVIGRKVAPIPYYSEQGCLVEIQQVGISSEAYQYYALLRDQSQTTGTLTDTPPATVVGNVTNTLNNRERVVGFFGAAATRSIRYWIDRSGYSDKGFKSSLLGHEVNLEPSTPPKPPLNEIRPPYFSCIAGRYRSPSKPIGWK